MNFHLLMSRETQFLLVKEWLVTEILNVMKCSLQPKPKNPPYSHSHFTLPLNQPDNFNIDLNYKKLTNWGGIIVFQMKDFNLFVLEHISS